jgi:hypothetical protein
MFQLERFIAELKSRENEFLYSDVLTGEPPDIHFQNRFRELQFCEPPPDDGYYQPPLEDARDVLKTLIEDYFALEAPNDILLVRASPGIGKSTASVGVAEDLAASGKRVAYAGPRHDFFMELMQKSKDPSLWYEWLPRQNADDSGEKIETCRHTFAINQWMQKGYQSIDFCSKICGWDYVRTGCVWHRQKRRTEPIIYIQHAHAVLGHPLKFNVMIGDESPISSFVHDWRIPGDRVRPSGLPYEEPLAELLDYIEIICANTNHMEGEELIKFLGGADDVLETCSSFQFNINAEALSPTLHNIGDVELADYFHLPNLVNLLAREARMCKTGKPYAHRIIIHKGYLTLLLRRDLDRGLPPHIAWMDATANKRIYSRCFQRPIKMVELAPRISGKIYQVVDRANGKGSLMTRNNERTSKAIQLETIINQIIEDKQYRSPSVISFQKFIEQSDIHTKKTAHFYGARGSNEMEECDAIIIAGTPQPNIFDIARMAKMVFFERDEAFEFGRFSSQQMPYRFADSDGIGRSYPVSGFWNDPDLQDILMMVREDEILQAAHRGRPINHPLDIWLMLNVPINGLPPDELLTMREIMDAPDGVDIFMWNDALQIINDIADNHNGMVTLRMLIESGYNRRTAMKYFSALTEKGGWVNAKFREEFSRRSQRAIERTGPNGDLSGSQE